MRLLCSLLLTGIVLTAYAEDLDIPPYPRIEVDTSHGSFVLELDGPRAPISVANFLAYVQEGGYDGTIFHRVKPGFVAQGGGYDRDFDELPTTTQIPNESGNGLSNERGTIAMARLGDPHSAGRQFYINLSDNLSLDPSAARWGYAVFGHVVEGLDVLDAVAELPTGPAGPFRSDVPQSPVTIKTMRLVLDD
ncbi:MAG: peptidylprolyl isomerase [Gammaproteobacteria bacterium]